MTGPSPSRLDHHHGSPWVDEVKALGVQTGPLPRSPTLDEVGHELASLDEARKMAVRHSAEILKDGASETVAR